MTTICSQHQLINEFRTPTKPVGERKFNGERSWCYSTGPADTGVGLECGSGVRCAGTSSRDAHRGDCRFQHRKRRPHQRRRRRRYHRAYCQYQWDFCAVHGRRLRTRAPAELQSPRAKVNSSLIERSRRPIGWQQRHSSDGRQWSPGGEFGCRCGRQQPLDRTGVGVRRWESGCGYRQPVD
jgi:hypothetical protein